MSRLSGKGRSRDSMIVHVRRGCLRAVAFALLWWMLTAGAVDAWLVGAPVVLIATLVNMTLVPAMSWSPVGILYFTVFFIWHSLRGGADVAWRVFHSRVPIAPDFIEYPLRLPPGLPRVFMVNTLSLLPGTLCAELGVNCLKIHVLDTRKSVLSELMTVEQVVARMFGISLQNAKGGECNEAI